VKKSYLCLESCEDLLPSAVQDSHRWWDLALAEVLGTKGTGMKVQLNFVEMGCKGANGVKDIPAK